MRQSKRNGSRPKASASVSMTVLPAPALVRSGRSAALLLYPIDLVKASGVARSMNFVSNIAALSVFVFSGQVDWIIGLSMGLSVMVGAFFGARTAISGGAKFIRPVFITVVLGLTVRLAWQHWFSVA
jgi:uncharacterized membrane protein YfcA